MQCKDCGTDNAPNSKFCKECGRKLEAAASKPDMRPEEHLKVGELIYAAYKHREAGRMEDAILGCQGALALNDASAPAHALLGSLYELKGDVASAIREYERVVALTPGNAADVKKLEDLKQGRIAVRPPVKQSPLTVLGRFSPYAPYAAAGAVFVIILILGLILVRGFSGRSASGTTQTAQAPAGGSPQPAVPVRPYASPYTQPTPVGQQPYPPAGQVQQPQASQPSAPPTPAPVAASPRASPAAQPLPLVQQAQPAPPKEPPVIVPVIENVPARTEPAAPRQPSISAVVKKEPAPQVSQPTGDPEQRALQLQRQGKYQDAISAYREALNQTSDSGRVYQQIALCYQRLSQHDMAIENYNRAIRSYKDQLAAGRDSAEVQRNIRSCEAGIQVSRSQSR